MTNDEDLRIRLEGGAELLDATCLRYRALVAALEAWLWKERLRRLSDLVLEAAGSQARVDEVLALAEHRAQPEAWPEGAVLRTVREVRELRTKLGALTARRLQRASSGALDADLRELELRASSSPRLVLPSRRWATACAVLPPTLDELAQARALTDLLEPAFGPQGELTLERWLLIEAAWPRAATALDRAWRRVERIDLTGGLARWLRSRARRQPHVPPEQRDQGPAVLIAAEYWRTVTGTRIEQRVTAAVSPVRCRPEEHWPVFGWLVRRTTQPALELAHAALPTARGALLELAVLLSGHASASQHPFERLRTLAAAADHPPHDDDWHRLRQGLALVVRVTTRPAKWLPPVHRVPAPQPSRPTPRPDATLGELLHQLERHLTQNKH